MRTSIRSELRDHLINVIEDQYSDDDTDYDELHFHAFNEDYYIIGYYQANEWLKEHDVSPFEAIETVIQWERDNFGEVNLKPEDMNSERIVNLYAYCLGEELVYSLNVDLSSTSKKEIIEAINNL